MQSQSIVAVLPGRYLVSVAPNFTTLYPRDEIVAAPFRILKGEAPVGLRVAEMGHNGTHILFFSKLAEEL